MTQTPIQNTHTTHQRRKHVRYQVQHGATLLLTNHEDQTLEIPCQLVDFSRHGLCFQAKQNIMRSNAELKIRFHISDDRSAIAGVKLLRSELQEGNTYSFKGELSFPTEEARRKIHAFLGTFSEDKIGCRRKENRRQRTATVGADKRNTDRRRQFGIFKECISFASRAPLWKEAYTLFQPSESVRPGRVLLNGRELISFGSKDYLGLAHDPRVKEAAIKAAERFGMSVSGSRAMNGTHTLHEQLEGELAQFKRQETAVLFALGYLTNIGILTTLLKQGDVAFVDEKAHGSIFNGCQYSGAKIVPFNHNSAEDLRRKIHRAKSPRSLIVIDGVYSGHGDLAVLPEIKVVASEEKIPLMVDDAHGVGILGETGAGTTERFGLLGQVDLDMGTFSAAFGGIGGFVACSKAVGDYLRHFSSAFTFTIGLPAPNIAALLAALRIIRTDTVLRSKLWSNVKYLKSALKQLGYTISPSESAVLAVHTHDENTTYRLDRELRKRGVYVNSFCRPTVKRGEAILRLSASAAHSDADLAMAVDAFQDVKPFLMPKGHH